MIKYVKYAVVVESYGNEIGSDAKYTSSRDIQHSRFPLCC